jgi:hypothetical protein
VASAARAQQPTRSQCGATGLGLAVLGSGAVTVTIAWLTIAATAISVAQKPSAAPGLTAATAGLLSHQRGPWARCAPFLASRHKAAIYRSVLHDDGSRCERRGLLRCGERPGDRVVIWIRRLTGLTAIRFGLGRWSPRRSKSLVSIRPVAVDSLPSGRMP